MKTNDQSRANFAAIRIALHEKYGDACVFCGIKDVPLEAAAIVPITRGGSYEIDNFLLLCPNCHALLDYNQPREIEFVDYLVSILSRSSKFRSVATESVVKDEGFPADIKAERVSDNGLQTLAVECKSYTGFSDARFSATLHQIKTYRKHIVNATYVLAFLGRLSERHRNTLSANGVELWDIDYLADTFQEEIKQVPHHYFQRLLLGIASTRTHDVGKALVAELHKCPRGKKHWVTYQKLIGRILEYLFCPPLKTPISELGDFAAVNRRDFILPNYASDGFWQFMRENYRADYVVADAKNYAKEVKKKEALQVANYLKPHGAGLFGLIICRARGDKGCEHTLREQWMAYRKLILILSDDDIEAMLLAKSSGGHAEDIISQKIEEFRLSM